MFQGIKIGECPVCGHSYSINVVGDFRCQLCKSHWRYDEGLEVTLHNEDAFNIGDVEHASITPADDGSPSFGDGKQCVDVIFKDGSTFAYIIDAIGIDGRRENIVIHVDEDEDEHFYFRVPVEVVKASTLNYDETIAALVALTLSVKGVEPEDFA